MLLTCCCCCCCVCTDQETTEGLLVAGDTKGAQSANKWTGMMLKMTALEPDDTVNAVDKMTPTEMGLLCALLGNNVIRAQTLYLSGLSLPQHTLV